MADWFLDYPKIAQKDCKMLLKSLEMVKVTTHHRFHFIRIRTKKKTVSDLVTLKHHVP